MCRPFIALLAALSCALAGGGAGAGAAETRHVHEAELAVPSPRAEVRAAGMAWRCDGVVCKAQGRDGKVTVRGCSELAKQAGAVRSYRSDISSLPADALERCNAGLPPAPSAAKVEGQPARIATRAIVYMGVWATEATSGTRAPQSDVFRRAAPAEPAAALPSTPVPPARSGGAAPAPDEPAPVWGPRLPVEPRPRATDE